MPLSAEDQAKLDDINNQIKLRQIDLAIEKRQRELAAGGANATPAPTLSPTNAPSPTTTAEPSLGAKLKNIFIEKPLQFLENVLETNHQSNLALVQGYGAVKSGINAAANTEFQGFGNPLDIPRLFTTPPNLPAAAATVKSLATNAPKALAAGVSAAGMALRDPSKQVGVNIAQTAVKSTDPVLSRFGAKAADFLIDAGTDPLNLLLGGTAGKAIDDALMVTRKAAVAKALSIPAVANAALKMKAVVQPLSESGASQAIQRGLSWFSAGPQAGADKAVFGDYRDGVTVQRAKLADTLQRLYQHAVDIQRDPATRAVLNNYAAVTKSNPILDLVKERMDSLVLPQEGAARKWLQIKVDARNLGIDPQVILDASDNLSSVFWDTLKWGSRSASRAQTAKIAALRNVAEDQPAWLRQAVHNESASSPGGYSQGVDAEPMLVYRDVDHEAADLQRTILANAARLKRMEAKAALPKPLDYIDPLLFDETMSAPHPHTLDTPEDYGLRYSRAVSVEAEQLRELLKAQRSHLLRLQSQAKVQAPRAPTLEEAFGSADSSPLAAQDRGTLPEDLGYARETAAGQANPNAPLKGVRRKQYDHFVEQVLGSKKGAKSNLFRMTNDQIYGASTDPSIIRQAGLRDLIHDLPVKSPDWVQPLPDSGKVRPGWQGIINEAGPLEPLYGYQMPNALYRALGNELAKAALTVSEQKSGEYIATKDILEAVNRATIGNIKKIDIGTLPSRMAHMVGVLGQQTNIFRTTGMRVSRAMQVGDVTRGILDARKIRLGMRLPKDLQEAVEHMPGLLKTEVDASLTRPSKNYGTLPKVIGKGKFSAVVPNPTGITARVFGTGKLGQAATVAQRVAMSPVDALVGAQREAEVGVRIATYRRLRRKFNPAQAAALVEKAHFDYADRGAALQIMDRFGLWAFNSFPTKSFNQMIDTIVNHPAELARYKRLRDLAVGNDDPRNNPNAPDYIKHSLFSIPIKGGYVDLGRFSPFGHAANFAYNLARGNVNPGNILDNTILGNALNIGQGNKAFSYDNQGHEKLLEDGQPSTDLRRLQGQEVAKSYFPFYAGGRAYQAVRDAAAGRAPSESKEPMSMADTLTKYLLGISEAKAPDPISAYIDRVISKYGDRTGPGASAFYDRVSEFWDQPTPANVKKAYEKLDSVEDPIGYKQALDQFMTYARKTWGSSRVINPKGEVVDKPRLDSAARAFVYILHIGMGEK